MFKAYYNPETGELTVYRNNELTPWEELKNERDRLKEQLKSCSQAYKIRREICEKNTRHSQELSRKIIDLEQDKHYLNKQISDLRPWKIEVVKDLRNVLHGLYRADEDGVLYIALDQVQSINEVYKDLNDWLEDNPHAKFI